MTEVVSRKLVHRLVIRELRALFQRNKRTPPQQNELQNIWEGNYFRDLDEYIEEDNQRLQELVRNTRQQLRRNRNLHGSTILRDEMLIELNRLREIMRGGDPATSTDEAYNRNKDLLYDILDEMELHVSLVNQTIFIHKKYGMFEISLNTGAVNFIPSTCLRCECRCSLKKRHICIVRHGSSDNGYCIIRNDGSEEGWIEAGLTPLDLLIISKAISIENNLLPPHVINQLRRSFKCNFIGSRIDRRTIQELKNLMLQELNLSLEDIGADYNPHLNPLGIRAILLAELRNFFQRVNNRH